jgi:phosphoglycerate dehydrogenase-like enzyme
MRRAMSNADRIVVRATLGRAPIIARLRDLAGDRVMIADDEAALIAGIAEAEAVFLTNPDYNAKIAAAMIAARGRIKWIQFLTAGYDAAKQHGVPPGAILTSAGDAYSPAVAAHAVSLLLALQRLFPAVLANQARGAWDRTAAARMATPASSTIAILGFGGIGKEVARLLRSFGPRIIAVTRSARPDPLADEVAKIGDLHAVLRRADAIVLALPLDETTEHFIGAAELALCKPNAVLVNIARGQIVDGEALAAALGNGTIAGAGTDVTEPEPLPAGHPLWRAPNLIITPHVAGACGPIGGERLATVAAENMRRYLAGEKLAHIVAL